MNKPQLTEIDNLIRQYVLNIKKRSNSYVFPVGEHPHEHIEKLLGGTKKSFIREIEATSNYRVEKMLPLVEEKKVFQNSIKDKLKPVERELKTYSCVGKMFDMIISRSDYKTKEFAALVNFLMKKTITAEDIENLSACCLISSRDELMAVWNNKFSKSKQVKLFKFLVACIDHDAKINTFGKIKPEQIENAKIAIQEYTSLLRETMVKFDENEQPTMEIVLSVEKLDFFTCSEQVKFVSCFRVGGEYNAAGPLCMQNANALIAYEPSGDVFQELLPNNIIQKKKQRVLIVFNEDYSAFWVGESKPGNNPRFTEMVEEICCELIELNQPDKVYTPTPIDAEVNFSNKIYLDMSLDGEWADEEDNSYEEYNFASSHFVYPLHEAFNRNFNLRFNPEIPHLLL